MASSTPRTSDTAEPGATGARRARNRSSTTRRDLVMGEILEHATRLFAERGYDGTTLQDIAEAIGITRPGLYNYISSKEMLLAALVADVTGSTAQMLRDIRQRDLSATEKLRAFVRALVLQRAAAPERFRVLDRTESALPEPIAGEHQAAKREVLSEAEAIIAEGIATGELQPKSERVAALSVIGMANWVAWWFHPGPDHPAEPIADQIAQNAVDMMVSPAGAHADQASPRRAIEAIRQNLDFVERQLAKSADD
ncbi:TetR/AcrR family transcriptional regulator [Amycolatopsis rhabdoformis]|uniref:TetR/AcrR family transcriptional regulator n=1 Tax=Amycolatopsis rhabdoformis TaxID=1448059 RepID=A0ABZ1IJX6_9PSEU|nr:TetR/AcrR family transcriptional regulator [Amycolatopsis rhabdoformis]WSE34737.1 TetR/AcrR family transcriptional regulator [Amycolatopsis rhabdoformis]